MNLTVRFYLGDELQGSAPLSASANEFNVETAESWFQRASDGEEIPYAGEDQFPRGTWDRFEIIDPRLADPLA